MLEVKNLTKIYAPKGGAQVRALDGVSLRFADRGMVFLLGKSGSGKSTLLNVCGGLDAPDSGEIIIMGRSSRDFSQSDFDSYRNTFVGFVFQEYNILEEFSVADNIAIALELQGRGRDRALVDDILKKVELTNFARRKPNTLSGGQKQRVAIARALVKDPQIILADEPTGALDSKTGRQILETLKNLSRDKLVIVVSHDREFAEYYGDRIIELKDGKVISDVTKVRAEAREQGNITFSGGAITIKKGALLTCDDLRSINDYLASSPNGAVLTNAAEDMSRYVADEHGGGGAVAFERTDEAAVAKRNYSTNEAGMIRSRLPMRHALRIGASSLKVKPFRLAFTILLSTIAFAMFGLFSTMTFFDPIESEIATYERMNYSQLRVEKGYVRDYVYYDSEGNEVRSPGTANTLFTPADYEAISEKWGNRTLAAFNYQSSTGYTFNITNINYFYEQLPTYYTNEVTAFAEFDPASWQGDMLTQTNLQALGPDDVIISRYTFDCIAFFGLTDEDGGEIELESPQDIVGRTIVLSSNSAEGSALSVTVAGVVEGSPGSEYDALKEYVDYAFLDEQYQETEARFYMLQGYSAYNLVLVSDDFYEAHLDEMGPPVAPDYGHTMLNYTFEFQMADGFDFGYYYGQTVNTLPTESGKTPEKLIFFDGRKEAALSSGEVVLPAVYLLSDAFETCAREYYGANGPSMDEIELAKHCSSLASILVDGKYISDVGDPSRATDEQAKAAAEEVAKVFAYAISSGQYKNNVEISAPAANIDPLTFTIAGFTYEPQKRSTDEVFYFSEDFYGRLTEVVEAYSGWYETNYVAPDDMRYTAMYVPAPHGLALSELVRGKLNIAEDDTFFAVNTAITSLISTVSGIVQILEEVFLWIGVVMAIFAMLLLFNFISVSITYKKKEIGILRAVGARSADVFRIFYSEAGIITAVCYFLAAIVSIVVCHVINEAIASEIYAVLLVFGPLSWLVMLGIALVTSVIATFLPVYAIAKRRPVESIRAL